jgi:hypothetical protein
LTAPSSTKLTFREGGPAELRTTFDLAQLAVGETARRMGVQGAEPPTSDDLAREWTRQRELLEFIVAQPGGR